MNIDRKIRDVEEHLDFWKKQLEQAEWEIQNDEDDLEFYFKAREMGYTDDEGIPGTEVARALREERESGGNDLYEKLQDFNDE